MLKKIILIFCILILAMGLTKVVSTGPLNKLDEQQTESISEKPQLKEEVVSNKVNENINKKSETEEVEYLSKNTEEVLDTNVSPEEIKNETLTEDNKETTNTENSKYIIAIDAGHQLKGNPEKEPIGPDALESKPKVSQGTTGKFTGVPEYQLTLDLALKLEERLLSEGFQVLMIRNTNDVNLSNAERAIIANEANADMFIRIHANGNNDSSVKGITTLCPTENNKYCSNIYESSYNLSKNLLDSLVASTGDKNLGVSKVDNMTGINWCTVPVSIVEVGFMSNEETDKLLQTEDYQNKIINGLVEGIYKYLD